MKYENYDELVAKLEIKMNFLQRNISYGLTDRNTGWDVQVNILALKKILV